MSDHTPSDRDQADADNATAVASNTSDRAQSDANQAETVGLLKTLSKRADDAITASNRSTEASENLALAMVAHQERARLAKRRYLVTLAIVLLGFGGLYWRQQIANDNSTHARHLIVDCVQPSTDPDTCYAKGQAQTAKILGDVTQISALAAACAPDYVQLPLSTRVVAIEKCILDGLKK